MWFKIKCLKGHGTLKKAEDLVHFRAGENVQRKPRPNDLNKWRGYVVADVPENIASELNYRQVSFGVASFNTADL